MRYRYIITTSVGLTPNQKDKIIELFPIYLKTTGDIYGRQDLNNLIGQFSQIEKLHFKLWLSSTNILERILYSKIHNQSIFEEDQIKNTIKTYVKNESFLKALDLLSQNKFIIISGIPGIGKTTLARILTYHFLANGFKEFIFLSDSINEAYSIFKEGESQIFLFDDFLGRNFLDKSLSSNEDARILRFIEKIQKSKNKLLILTTREYILKQAKQKHDLFDQNLGEYAKCVIDLSQYTKIIKAKILYNHLFFSDLPSEYITNILLNQKYKQIIEHRNYNPRIIETMTKPGIWKMIKAENFIKKVINFLEYLESIWKHVYENQISKLSQDTLAILMTLGTPVLLEDLKIAVQNFYEIYRSKYGIIYDEIEFEKTIKELENTFIITKKDDFNSFAIEYQNPSVQDFLVFYFESRIDFLVTIINSAAFFNQLFIIFSIKDGAINANEIAGVPRNRIKLNSALVEAMKNKIIKDYEKLKYSIINKNYHGRWYRMPMTECETLEKISHILNISNTPDLKAHIIAKFNEFLEDIDLSGGDHSSFIYLLNLLKSEITIDVNIIIATFFDQVYGVMELYEFNKLEDIFTDHYQTFMNDEENYYDKIIDIVDEAVMDIDDENLEEVLDEIKHVASLFEVDCTHAIQKINQRIEQQAFDEESSIRWDEDDWRNTDSKSNPYNEDEIIRNMFDSLNCEDDILL